MPNEGTAERKEEQQPASVPKVSLPTGGGAIRGIGEKFTANSVTGTGSMSVPIATSPGRSGFGPQISLSYDSGSGNGPFGFGWSLSTPAITRKTDKGLPQYRDAEESDVYILSGAEDLVPVIRSDGTRFKDDTSAPGYVINRYRPRIEGLFARIERWTDSATGEIHWRSITRDSVTTLYGKDNNSRVFDPNDPAPTNPTRIFSWLICASYDDKGNAAIYEYAEENSNLVLKDKQGKSTGLPQERNRDDNSRSANRYLKRIKYGNRTPNRDQSSWLALDPRLLPADTWMFEVVFDYDEGHYEEIDFAPATPKAEKHEYALASSELPSGSAWAVRPDPFSSYRAGFEVRTYRRCRRVLMFHHIPALPTGEKGYEGLVRSTEFDYADLDYGQRVSIESELAHQGSTRFASFTRRITQSGYVRDDNQLLVEREGVKYATYLKKSLPPLEFEYSKAAIQNEICEIDADSLENLPAGLDGATYQWVDLDGEGVSGMLTEQGGGWFYKPNLGDARFAPAVAVAAKPSLAALSGGRQHLIDLAGEGQLDLVALSGPTPGFFERTQDENWECFRTFQQMPNVRWDDPNLRFVDLDGDGHADVLITEQDALTWHGSLAEEGFGPARRVRQIFDEERGPRLVLADGTQSIYLANMSGDGLTDLVRIRNGEVCYWPNLGYGRFGPKVAMDNAPWFDTPEGFSQRRIRVADIDGSGTTDIIYLGHDGVRLYFNQSGNRWSEAYRLAQFPQVDSVSAIQMTDLLGNGTACLVWSSPLPADASRPLRYIDLVGGNKPHLLTKSVNNLGAETRVHYTPSTWFYLEDKRNGRPWVTRLPFPVYVVDRVETYDHISGNRFVIRYTYHHGYFDGVEREFRGFGLVEQRDTEEFAALNADGQVPAATNIDLASHVPPVLTKTWFHTGVYDEADEVSQYLAAEYYGAPSRDNPNYEAEFESFLRGLLPDTVLPLGLTIEEEREACRALKGSMLRQEVYGLDGTDKEKHPYTVTEQNFTVRVLQGRCSNRHGMFFTYPREAISCHYERDPADPRIGHALTLEVDDFGNVLRSITVGYPRADVPERMPEQSETHLTLTLSRFANRDDQAGWYRVGLPVETRTYEVVKPPTASLRFGCEELRDLFAALVPLDQIEPPSDKTIPYEQWDWRRQWNPQTEPGGLVNRQPVSTRLRLIEHMRTLYRKDDLTALAPLGIVESLALPGETYKLAFTPSLVAKIYGGWASASMLENQGGYVHTEGDTNWWIPSGRILYSPDPTDTPPKELAHARQHSFLAHRYRDPFHTEAVSTEIFVTYDGYDLLVHETRDALGNRVTAGEREHDLPSGERLPDTRRNDYRVLLPELVMDPNRNCSEVAFDALGMVAGTAVMGKPEDDPRPGDWLDELFRRDLTQAQTDAFMGKPREASADPNESAATEIVYDLLRKATTRIIYDLDRYKRVSRPPFAATVARETHVSELEQNAQPKIQASFSYSDGFGREIQKKIQAECGPVPKRDGAGRIIVDADGRPEMTANAICPRWVGSGWTVFNNKGKPVRQYEPFFSDTHGFDFDARIGVSPVLFYDPVERVVATLHPNHTWEKVVFSPWRQATWDVNDTVLKADPKADAEVGAFFCRLNSSEYLPTWHALRTDPANAVTALRRWPDPKTRDAERRAAEKSSSHAETPAVAHTDTLGRTFLTVSHNKLKYSDAPLKDPPIEAFYDTRITLDIENNHREVIDAKDRVVMRYDYNLLGQRTHQISMEAGERRILSNVVGKPVRTWDSRGVIRRVTYDQLRRPTGLYVTDNGTERLAERTDYGESWGDGTNHHLRVYQVRDGAGLVTNAKYDFKGNLLETRRELLPDYDKSVNWLQNPLANDGAFTGSTTYDALNRVVAATTPEGSVYRPGFNEANLLEKVVISLRGASAAVEIVTDVAYNAKGQRTRIRYGNDTETRYEYDYETFRLVGLKTARPVGCNGVASQIFTDPSVVQDLRYSYDPVGNITRIEDAALKSITHSNQLIEPIFDYVYDAVYRLIEAKGREHIGQTGFDFNPQWGDSRDYPFVGHRVHPKDLQALRSYTERYEVDAVGNFGTVRHAVNGAGWTRRYDYEEDSIIEPAKKSNRLTRTVVGNGSNQVEKYTYRDAQGNDVHGCMTSVNNMQMAWDFRNQLRQVNLRGGGTAYYVYDAGGQRVRKVIMNQNGVRRSERIYLGGYEIYREYEGTAQTKALERETLHIMDGKQRTVTVETKTVDRHSMLPAPDSLIRYQFNNHLGSACVELDAGAELISYEEYSPYGGTAFQAAGAAEVSLKRYRYIGKERDEETGFYYHGARYYAVWLGRWTEPDPAGLADGANQLAYAADNPVRLLDPSGLQSAATKQEEQAHQSHVVILGERIPGGGDYKGHADKWLQILLNTTTVEHFSQRVSPGDTLLIALSPLVTDEERKALGKVVKDFERRFVDPNTGKPTVSVLMKTVSPEKLASEVNSLNNIKTLMFFGHGHDVPLYDSWSKFPKPTDFKSTSFSSDAVALWASCNLAEYAKEFTAQTGVTSLGVEGTVWFGKETVSAGRLSPGDAPGSSRLWRFDLVGNKVQKSGPFAFNTWGIPILQPHEESPQRDPFEPSWPEYYMLAPMKTASKSGRSPE